MAQQRTRLSLVTWQDENSSELGKCASILAEFSRLYPQYKVDMTYQSRADAYGRLSRWCGSLNEYAPDMTIIPSQWMREFAHHLYAFGPSFARDLQPFFPAVLSSAIIDGRTHGIPWRMDAEVLYYRSDLLEQAELKPPRTWNELKTAAMRVADPDSGIYGFGMPGAVGGGAARLLLMLLWSSNGSVEAADGTIDVTGDKMTAVLDYYVQLARTGALQPEVLSWDQSGLHQLFVDGKLAMIVSDSTLATRLHQTKSSLSYAVSPLPAGDQPLSFVSVDYLVVMRSSRNREACLEFLKFMASKTVQERMLVTGTIPSHWEVAQRFTREPPMDAFVSNLEHARSRPSCDWQLLQAILDDALFMAISGRNSSAEALQQAQARLLPTIPPAQ